MSTVLEKIIWVEMTSSSAQFSLSEHSVKFVVLAEPRILKANLNELLPVNLIAIYL